MTFGSLFSGIGGFDLGLERAGMRCQWQVEVDPYCRNILQRHWPEVPRWGDIRLIDPDAFGLGVDLICGGFPCTDISSARTATKRRGLGGNASGLWSQMYRIVVGQRPRWVLVENSPEWKRWVPDVRADLARDGYASLPVVLSAAHVGAPHARPRAFVIAHADSDGESLLAFNAEVARLSSLAGKVPWPSAPVYLGMDDGVPGRMDRLRMLGNAVVPQVAEVIGRAILSAEIVSVRHLEPVTGDVNPDQSGTLTDP